MVIGVSFIELNNLDPGTFSSPWILDYIDFAETTCFCGVIIRVSVSISGFPFVVQSNVLFTLTSDSRCCCLSYLSLLSFSILHIYALSIKGHFYNSSYELTKCSRVLISLVMIISSVFTRPRPPLLWGQGLHILW